MPTSQHPPAPVPRSLRTGRVLRVEEDACVVSTDESVDRVGFASVFPSPRVERVSPGHLVAVAVGPDGTELVLWRWYDAVVLGLEDEDGVRLWEPAHGEFLARARPSYQDQRPGARVFASAGLPGAEWWAACRADGGSEVDVELEQVVALYTDNDLWRGVFDVR